MPRKPFMEAVRAGKPLVSDGAWGTMLQAKGLASGACPEPWNIERPDDVAAVARAYKEAGANMVGTNSFGGSRVKLAHYGLSERAAELNEAAARLSRNAVGEDVYVLGSIGPSGKLLLMEEVTEEELMEAFTEQAVALERGGADAICIETMSDPEEACIAIRAAKGSTSLPVICTFTFDRTQQGFFKTMFGTTPEEAMQQALEAGADMTGANCGNGIEVMTEIIRQMRTQNPDVPLLVQANAGLPIQTEVGTVFPETPEDMAKHVSALIEAGANIIGGCCGTTPAHIKAIVEQAETIG